MTIDQEHSHRVESIRAEQNELKKFQIYMEYLKDKTATSGAADLLKVNFETLTNDDLLFYKEVVTYLKSLNENNCNAQQIQDKCTQFVRGDKKLSQPKLLEWFINSLSSLLYTAYISDGWDGNGDENKAIKKFVKSALNYIDPENLF